MKYTVQITETLQRFVEVEAGSPEDAEAIVRRQYRAGDIVLDSSDHVATEFAIE